VTGFKRSLRKPGKCKKALWATPGPKGFRAFKAHELSGGVPMTTSTRLWLLGLLFGVLLVAQSCEQATPWERHNAAGLTSYEEGYYAEAEEHWKAALKEAENFGPQDPRLATSLNNLAVLYRAQGRYAEAEPRYTRALAIFEKALGPEHPVVAMSLENYAAFLRETGRETKAQKVKARATAIRTKREKTPTK